MSTKAKILKAWRNFPSNLTQTSRFKKEIDKKAADEAHKIFHKVGNKGYVSSTKMPKFDVPANWSKEKQAYFDIYGQVKKHRRKEAKEKGII